MGRATNTSTTATRAMTIHHRQFTTARYRAAVSWSGRTDQDDQRDWPNR